MRWFLIRNKRILLCGVIQKSYVSNCWLRKMFIDYIYTKNTDVLWFESKAKVVMWFGAYNKRMKE